MKKREYYVLVNNNGEMLIEQFNTLETIICLCISKFNKKYDILKLKRAYFLE